MRLKDYSTMQTTEMVWHIPFVFYVAFRIFHFFLLFLTYFPWFFMVNYSRGLQSNEITFPHFPTAVVD